MNNTIIKKILVIGSDNTTPIFFDYDILDLVISGSMITVTLTAAPSIIELFVNSKFGDVRAISCEFEINGKRPIIDYMVTLVSNEFRIEDYKVVVHYGLTNTKLR